MSTTTQQAIAIAHQRGAAKRAQTHGGVWVDHLDPKWADFVLDHHPTINRDTI